MPRLCIIVLAVFLAATGTADPKEGGWRPLFDGTDLAGWTSAAGAGSISVVISGPPGGRPSAWTRPATAR